MKQEANSLDPVTYRGGHMQIIACAGSGKTHTLVNRIASLVQEGNPPASIIAFTFTEKAAAELKSRAVQKIREIKGEDFLDRLSPMFIGTIHGYCFRMLQESVPKFGAYDVIDENQLAALVSREFWRLGLSEIRERYCNGRRWWTINRFLANVDLIENELIPFKKIKDPYFAESYQILRECLHDLKLLTYGQQIACAIEELQKPDVFARVHGKLRHLIVDEYQDINPAQERLISLLAKPPVQLCVVGDDDQSIYQWRGSNVNNILTFSKRFPGVKTFPLSKNYRSRPGIIQSANHFSPTIDPRLDKKMEKERAGDGMEVALWKASTPVEEAEQIALQIKKLHSRGYSNGDVAILLRSTSTAAEPIRDALDKDGIPYECAGRSGLFEHPEAKLFGTLYSYLAGRTWTLEEYGTEAVSPNIDELCDGFEYIFGTDGSQTSLIPELHAHLRTMKAHADTSDRYPNLLLDYYKLLRVLGVQEWNLTEAEAGRMGVLSRFANILQDFEHTKRRMHRNFNPREFKKKQSDPKSETQSADEEVSRCVWYYRNLHGYLQYYAMGSYEEFQGEETYDPNVVTISTIHSAKGLEWPIVFMPSLTSKRFPSSNTGRKQTWFLSDRQFDRERYEGTEADERRLFYVAMTRARDFLYLSHFDRLTRAVEPSPFVLDLSLKYCSTKDLPLPPNKETTRTWEDPAPTFSFSDLSLYEGCPYSYRLRNLFNFGPPLVEAIGYGRAVHHVLRLVADETKRTGEIPPQTVVDSFFDEDFYLPFASPETKLTLRDAAVKLVARYMNEHHEDLYRVWETERAFELHLGHANVSGRADVILDREGGEVNAMAIVDYKTAVDGDNDETHHFQLGIYTSAGRGEGIDVRAAYVHDLKRSERTPVDVSEPYVTDSRLRAARLALSILSREYPYNPGQHCKYCDVRLICKHGEDTK